jgi:hypothetical protein
MSLKNNAAGDLSWINKSDEDLDALLLKQQSLLKNRRCVERLPDKGEKIRRLIAKIQDELQLRKSRMDDAAEGLSRMVINGSNHRATNVSEYEDKELADQLGRVINTGQREKVYVNCYDRVMSRAEQEPCKRQSKFVLNRFAAKTLQQDTSTPTKKAINLNPGLDKSTSGDSVTVTNNRDLIDPLDKLKDFHNQLVDSMIVSSDDHYSQSDNVLEGSYQNLSSSQLVGSTKAKEDSVKSDSKSNEFLFGKVKHRYDEGLQDLRNPQRTIKILDFGELAALADAQTQREKISNNFGIQAQSTVPASRLKYRDVQDDDSHQDEDDDDDLID